VANIITTNILLDTVTRTELVRNRTFISASALDPRSLERVCEAAPPAHRAAEGGLASAHVDRV
jgi:hypothetical protein